MKKNVFVIEDNEKKLFFKEEKSAREESEKRNKNFIRTKVEEETFNNMVNQGIFIDSPVVKVETSGSEQVQALEPVTEKHQLIALIEELKSMLDVLKKENEELKNHPRINLDNAHKMYEKRLKLKADKEVFNLNDTKIIDAIRTMENVLDYDENQTFRLVLNIVDHKERQAKELFSISTNFVIKNTLRFVKTEIKNKVEEIQNEIEVIEKATI